MDNSGSSKGIIDSNVQNGLLAKTRIDSSTENAFMYSSEKMLSEIEIPEKKRDFKAAAFVFMLAFAGASPEMRLEYLRKVDGLDSDEFISFVSRELKGNSNG